MHHVAHGVLLSGSGSIIDVDGTLFVQLALFFVLFFLLKRMVFQPLLVVYAAREQAIDGARKEVRELERSLQAGQEQYEQQLQRVRATAAEEQERLRTEGGQLERSLLDKVKHETQSMLEQAKQDLEHEAKRVQEDMQARLPAMAQEAASKVLGRAV